MADLDLAESITSAGAELGVKVGYGTTVDMHGQCS